MYPLVFGNISSYGLLFPFMVAVPITFCLWRLTRHEGQSLAAVALCFTAILLGAVMGAKLFSLGLRDWQVASNWRNELIGGWRWSGLLIGLAIAVPLSKRFFLPDLSLQRLGDTLGLALPIAMAFGRVVCFITGCCVGGHGDSFLHLSFAQGSQVWYQQLQSGLISAGQPTEPVLALQIPFFIASLLVAVLLFRLDRVRQYDGQVLLAFLAFHESSKAVLELWRVPLIPEQLAVTIFAGLTGFVGLYYFHRFPPAANLAHSRYRTLPAWLKNRQ